MPVLNLEKFVRESNAIEGIHRKPTREEMRHSADILSKGIVSINDLEVFVSILIPVGNRYNRLRDREGLDVHVGGYKAPSGGPEIRDRLEAILRVAPITKPFFVHGDFEYLHPFTDGNGRVGRLLWLHGMMREDRENDTVRNVNQINTLGFLHVWYYQSLENWNGAP